GDDAVAEERRDAPAGRVEELVGDDEVERPNRLLHAADRRDRDHPLGAERLEAPDVRAEVQLRRHDPVAPTVARQEDHAPPRETPDAVGVRRRAEGRADAAPPDVRQPLELIEPAAADDPDRRVVRFPSVASAPRVRSRSASVTRPRARRPWSAAEPTQRPRASWPETR